MVGKGARARAGPSALPRARTGSHHNATTALNGIIKAPLVFSGIGNVLGPRKRVGGKVGGGSPPCRAGDGLVLADADLANSTGEWRGKLAKNTKCSQSGQSQDLPRPPEVSLEGSAPFPGRREGQ